ncbi:MAG: hypothetical protein O2943_06030 [Actinomycetota bacterium]|nr:hypothetical protein [Actinomycetota bacterium]
MKIRQRSIAAIAAVTLFVTPALAACGESAEQAAEQIAENAMGGEVDIEEGNVTITDDQGNEMVAGADVALPENWPLPVPDSGTLAMATVQTDGTAYAMWVVDSSAVQAATQSGWRNRQTR